MDTRWRRLQPLLPPEKPWTGRPIVDAAVIRAHQHAAGARRTRAAGNGENVGALGRSHGGFSTKLHLRADGPGTPIIAVPTVGERHEPTALDAPLDGGAIRGPARGPPSPAAAPARFDREADPQRNRIERLINRYPTNSADWSDDALTMVMLGMILLWL